MIDSVDGLCSSYDSIFLRFMLIKSNKVNELIEHGKFELIFTPQWLRREWIEAWDDNAEVCSCQARIENYVDIAVDHNFSSSLFSLILALPKINNCCRIFILELNRVELCLLLCLHFKMFIITCQNRQRRVHSTAWRSRHCLVSLK